MPKFAANLTMLFNEYPFLDRFRAAHDAGFQAVEFLFPYDWRIAEIRNRAQQAGVEIVLFNLPAGDWQAGERGIASSPDRVEEFRAGVALAIEYAKGLNVTQLHCMSGLYTPDRYQADHQFEVLVDNVCYAADEFSRHDLKLMIEPINSRIDMPGYIIDTLGQADKLLARVGRPNVYLQFDIYHMQIMHGDLLRKLGARLSQIGHIQFADYPGRHQPGTGEIDFDKLFREIDLMGYKGWVAAEYLPDGKTEDTLAWLTGSQGVTFKP